MKHSTHTHTVSQTESPSCLAAVLYSALIAGAFKDTSVSVGAASCDLLAEARAAVNRPDSFVVVST